MRRIETHGCFGGTQEVWAHESDVLAVTMRFGFFRPPQRGPRPMLTFLSGLTCTEQNAITKSGAQRYCAEHGLALLTPDTSPRGEGVADDEGYDLGQGAGFYLNATQAPWAEHYRMYDYVRDELPALVRDHFDVTEAESICGHSMGGHGALILALKNPGRYRSVSALAPISAPSQVPWGHKAFGAYLGQDRATWAAWDATELVHDAAERLPLLIDQGLADNFLAEQLRPEIFEAACAAAGHPLTMRRHEGYDHGYYFIATRMGEHVAHAAAAL